MYDDDELDEEEGEEERVKFSFPRSQRSRRVSTHVEEDNPGWDDVIRAYEEDR